VISSIPLQNIPDNINELLALSEERYLRLMSILRYEAKDLQDLLDYALHEAILLTKSKLGYIYFYSEATKQFTINSWSKDVMQECTITNPQTVYEMEKTGLWGEVVRQRKSIIINDFQAPNPLKKGYPEGHAPLTCFLTIPIFDHQEIIAVVGLANKETAYTEEDLKQLELFMAAVWLIVEQKKLEATLEDKTKELEKINKYMVGRELKMVELKKELERLTYNISQPPQNITAQDN
jgi:GAF domain-containing protein